MGYTTDFTGAFRLNRTLEAHHSAYLKKFSATRRMKRDASMAAAREDGIRTAAGLDIGIEGAYFVGAGGFAGQERTPDILAYNDPPTGQPELWCQWVPTSDDTGIEWNGTKKFYKYVQWLQYLVEHFLAPWGYQIDGQVRWQGEDPDDSGVIHVRANRIQACADQRAPTEPHWGG